MSKKWKKSGSKVNRLNSSKIDKLDEVKIDKNIGLVYIKGNAPKRVISKTHVVGINYRTDYHIKDIRKKGNTIKAVVPLCTDSDRLSALHEMGINVSIIDRNDTYRRGYVLGTMRDRHPNIAINTKGDNK